MTSEQETVKPVRGTSWLTSLRLWVAIACLLLVCTVLLLPLPLGIRASILGVLIFSGVFTLVDAGGKGKIFAALTVALLGLKNLPMFSKQIRTAGKPGLISRACTMSAVNVNVPAPLCEMRFLCAAVVV